MGDKEFIAADEWSQTTEKQRLSCDVWDRTVASLRDRERLVFELSIKDTQIKGISDAIAKSDARVKELEAILGDVRAANASLGVAAVEMNIKQHASDRRFTAACHAMQGMLAGLIAAKIEPTKDIREVCASAIFAADTLLDGTLWEDDDGEKD